MITLGSFKDLGQPQYDETWIITRGLKDRSVLTRYQNTIHVPELSPTPELFQWYLFQKKNGWWGVKHFDIYYVSQFIRDIAGDASSRNRLNELYTKHQAGKNILIVCFCTDERICHRSIIGGLLQGIGVEVKSTTVNDPDYSYFYASYKNYRSATKKTTD